ncbi:hypothetical protein A2U01_0109120, partial [Trifolium medium]|nr:hypothetical protein [Trifolium medium]
MVCIAAADCIFWLLLFGFLGPRFADHSTNLLRSAGFEASSLHLSAIA